MKKIKSTSINKKCQKLITELNKTDFKAGMIADVGLSVFGTEDLKDLYQGIERIDDMLLESIKDIRNNNPRFNIFVDRLIEKNNKYVKKFIVLSEEELLSELDKDASPAISGFDSVSPDMIVFYYISNNIKIDSKYELAEEKYKKDIMDFEKSNTFEKIQKLDVFNEKCTGLEIFERMKDLINDKGFIDSMRDNPMLLKNYGAEDLDNGLNVKVRKAILGFFDVELYDIIRQHTKNNESAFILGIMAKKFSLSFANKKEEFRNIRLKNTELINENNILKRENLFLKNENKIINKSLEELPNKDKEELIKVKKENNYLSSKIDKLELELKDLKEELESIHSIKENLIVEIPKETEEIVNIYNGETIVIVGGFWSEQERLNVQRKYKATFVNAEDVLKSIDKIRNYDIIIFDTSRNSHINFFKIKSLRKMLLINKSNLNSINELLEK